MNTMTEKVPPGAIELYKGEMPVGHEMRCPVVVLVDKSSSMAGNAIMELNRGLKIFQTQMQNDEVASKRLEIAVITFGSEVEVIRDFSLLEGTAIETIVASGATDMAGGLREGMARIEARKVWYKEVGLQYFRPYIIIITDGYPTSLPEEISAVQKEIHDAVLAKKFNIWAFGVDGADMNFLQTLTPEGFPPQKLKGHNFVEFFEWLSNSFGLITASKPEEKIDISPKADKNPFQITV